MHQIILPYNEAKPLIQEGDVLLFRGKKWYSFIIKKITQSLYSHVALASWHNGDKKILEVVEFHLWLGGASRNLDNIVSEHSGCIDVYRPSPIRLDLEYDKRLGLVEIKSKYHGKAVTQTMRSLTALPYSLFRIGIMARAYMFGIRLLSNLKLVSDDAVKTSASYVCSTSVAYSMNVNGYDLVKNKSDLRTEPGDIASSPLLNYLFTIK